MECFSTDKKLLHCLIILFLCFERYEVINANIAKHLVKIHKQQKHPDEELTSWQENTCQKLKSLFQRKQIAIKRLQQALKLALENNALDPHEKHFQNETFMLFQKELNVSEDLIWHSIVWLHKTLKGDYKNLIDMKESSRVRLEALRDATLQEEQEYNAILEAEKYKKKIKPVSQSKVQGMLDKLLADVALAADKLEKNLDDHVFEDAVRNPKFGHGANIEAVVRLESDDDETQSRFERETGANAVKLVDAHDNQFVLSKGRDSTVPHDDHHFIRDIIYVFLLAFPLGLICTLLRLPTMFGFIVTGIVLGPSGMNVLKSLVQVETIGEFGVFFILFTVGLKFSPANLQKVLKVAIGGSVLQIAVMTLTGVLLGNVISATVNESAFIAACLSLSSTPLVVKFLSEEGFHEVSGEVDYAIVLLGILVIQDILLGLIVALLPHIAGHDISKESTFQHFVHLTFNLILSIFGTMVLTFFMSKTVIKLYKSLVNHSNKEIPVLSTISLVFAFLLMTDYLHISMELGCFLAGAAISGSDQNLSEDVNKVIEPVKDFLGVIFFASIGLHVFPSFLAYELTILVILTVGIVAFKYVLSVLILGTVLSPKNRHIRWIVAAGLSQVSEFSFVLGSRARRLGLISREVYLLILSITTLSLLLAPLLWRLSLWRHGSATRHSSLPHSSSNDK